MAAARRSLGWYVSRGHGSSRSQGGVCMRRGIGKGGRFVGRCQGFKWVGWLALR